MARRAISDFVEHESTKLTQAHIVKLHHEERVETYIELHENTTGGLS